MSPVTASLYRMGVVANVDALVLNTVNASWRHAIDAPTLVGILEGRDPGEWVEHVRTFFEDVPREAILRFVLAHELPARRLLATYREIVPVDEREDDGIDGWLAELADAA